MMVASEKLCLQWNDFQKNITSSFRELREDREFTDVTLACEDGSKIEAHKVVLASSSPFFLELLKRNKHPNPLLYMRGLRSDDLIAIVDFLYNGEANVFQENLDSFLALAEELKLKGLTGNTDQREEPRMETVQNTRTKLKAETSQRFQVPPQFSEQSFEQASPLKGSYNDTAVSLTNEKISVNLQDLDEKIKSMFTKTNLPAGGDRGYLASCNICGKQRPLKLMPSHVEANHITGVSHECDICGKVSRSRDALRVHISNLHDSRLQKVITGPGRV